MNEPVPRRTVARRVRAGVVTWVAVLVVLRLFVVQPERCGDPTSTDIREAATYTVNWFVRNQGQDGRWLYRYDAARNLDLGVKHLVIFGPDRNLPAARFDFQISQRCVSPFFFLNRYNRAFYHFGGLICLMGSQCQYSRLFGH